MSLKTDNNHFIINGGRPLTGEVVIGGAKNAALAIIAASVMTDETVTIENIPDVRDTNVMMEAMEGIGVRIKRLDRHTIEVNGSQVDNVNIDTENIRKIRASYYLIGALLGKYRHAEVPLPGGCDIGSRPIDQHVKGFKALGASVNIKGGIVKAHADSLSGAHIYMDVVLGLGLGFVLPVP